MKNLMSKIETFEARWFMVSMSTGAFGIFTFLMGNLWGIGIFKNLAIGFCLGAISVFLVAGIFYILRIFYFFESVKKDLDHPIAVNFLAGISISSSVLSATVSRVLVPTNFLSNEVGFWMAGIFYGFGFFSGLFFLWTAFFRLITSEKANLQHAVGIWLLPPVGLFVAVFAGNFWTRFLPENAAHSVILTNLLVFGIAFLLYFFVMGLIVNRLKTQPLPPVLLSPSFFIPLAPPGVIMIALWSFVGAMNKSAVFEPIFSEFLAGSVILSVIFSGFGIFWLTLATSILRHYQKKDGKIPFSLGFWAFVFPVNAFGIGIFLAAQNPILSSLLFVAEILWVLSFALWVFVAIKTGLAMRNEGIHNSL